MFYITFKMRIKQTKIWVSKSKKIGTAKRESKITSAWHFQCEKDAKEEATYKDVVGLIPYVC